MLPNKMCSSRHNLFNNPSQYLAEGAKPLSIWGLYTEKQSAILLGGAISCIYQPWQTGSLFEIMFKLNAESGHNLQTTVYVRHVTNN